MFSKRKKKKKTKEKKDWALTNFQKLLRLLRNFSLRAGKDLRSSFGAYLGYVIALVLRIP